MSKASLMQGNEACALGLIAAGANFFAGYPITPSTEVAEIFAQKMPALGGKFIQMEDEIASMGAVCGAALTGAKAVTATSGPGFSLKQELIGYAAITEIPAVIVNVQRLGPSTGRPTSPAQGDVMQARWGSHGDRGVIALSPGSVRECFDVAVSAINFSEKYRTPVVILLDEVIGHMRERVELPAITDLKIINRKQPTVSKEEFEPYKPDEDGVPPMAAFGSGYRYHVTGLVHNESGRPTEDNIVADKLIRRLNTKIEKAQDEITLYTEHYLEDAEIVVVSYGGSARAAIAAVKEARKNGIKVGLLKLITIWPFPQDVLLKVAEKSKAVIVAEMNYGQLVTEIERYIDRKKIISVTRVDGQLFVPEEILEPIIKADAVGGAKL